MKKKSLLLKALKKGYRLFFNPSFEAKGNKYLDRQEANDKIYDLLINDKPCMIARFGTTEIGILTNYLSVHSKEHFLQVCKKYITDSMGLPWWDKLYLEKCKWASGIFPQTIETLENFSKRYFEDIPEIDLLGSFNYTEKYMPLRNDVQYVHLECLYPFFVDKPWTRALKGKKILVVHPFAETIQYQYSQREKIFDNPNILPEYELLTFKAVQSGAGAEVPYKDWFEALKYMENEISKINFDICILGCGAYGLPLAAHIKRLGKKAIHIGGGTQLLWGIKGKRWDNNAYIWKELPQLNTNYSLLYNEYWVRASNHETPRNSSTVEGGCYW